MLFSSALLNCKLQCVCKIKTSWQFYMQNDTRGGGYCILPDRILRIIRSWQRKKEQKLVGHGKKGVQEVMMEGTRGQNGEEV